MEATQAVPARTPDLSGSLQRLLECDFTQRLPFAVLGLVFFLARLPYINYGHGTDPDAWRVAITAHHLLETGKYFPSRLPGNPLHEMIMTLVIPAGWLGTNIATAAAALAGVYLFALIVKHLELPNRGLLTVGFAFTPLLYINSIATMDYMWTLTVLLAAFYFILRGWIIWAGVALGLAIGFRLQSLIAFLPLAYLVWRYGGIRPLLPFSLAAGGMAALAFAPVLAVYGLDFANFYDAKASYQDVLRLLGKEALGVLGGMGVLAGAAISLRRFRTLPWDVLREPWLGASLLLIFIYFFSFFRLPHEIAYLVPVFPFGILFIGRYFTRIAATGALAAILLAGVVDITTPSDALTPGALRSAEIGKGLILSNGDTMSQQHKFVDDVLDSDVPGHSVVMTGFIFPQLAVREWDRLELKILERDYGAISMLSDRGESVDNQRDVRFVWLLTYDTFMALRSQGYSFFLVPDAAGGTAALYDYRPTLFGATFLQLERSAPSASEGTASTDR